MQQRGTGVTSMETECEDKTYQGRGRNFSKLKVLVRSHAMREETSPPREPTPTPLVSPCIKLTPSPADSPNSSNSLLVISPSMSRRNSPARSSPSSTIVPSPTRCSPNNYDIDNTNQIDYIESELNPKYLNNNKINRQNLEKSRSIESIGKVYRTEIIVEESSQIDNRKGKNDKYTCDDDDNDDDDDDECTSQSCVKCVKVDKHLNNNINCNNNNSNTLTVNRGNFKGKFKHQSSSQGSFEGSSSNSPCLSRDSSSEQYTDTTGVDLELFIPETLNRNAKDRAIMLRIEQELVNLAKDKTKSHYKFPPMSSYQRMLVHRCAAYFGMDHNIESSGKCVVVNKTKNTRIPEIPFKQHIKSDIVFSEEPRRSILKRDSNSTEDYNFKSPDRQHSFENRRSKSFEEREEEYEKVRRRIFSVEMPYSSNDELWSDIPWSSVESDNSTRLRLPSEHHTRSGGGRLLKVQSEDVGAETLRPCVAKSYSFGGYGGVSVLTRGDSVISTRSEGAKLLIKQDSAASSVSWRLSPSSSGYKTQSQRSESVTPSPTSTPYLSGQDSTNSVATNTSDNQMTNVDGEGADNQVVWAVTDIQSVPKGSIIINPQTGQPVKNNDGSIYHYDPRNPPPGLNNTNVASKPPPSPQKSNSPNKVKDRSTSPKKKPLRTSPIKKSITNSSTSPSLPFTPPSPQTRIFSSYIPSNENITNVPIQTQYPVYGNNYGPTPEGPLPVYPQPYIVYTTPYSMPVPFEGRNEPVLPEMQGYYVNIPTEAPVNPTVQPVTYQTQPIWNQQPMFYPNVTPNHSQRFATVPMPSQSGSYLPATYPTNFVPQQHGQNISGVPQPSQTPEVVSVYSQPPVHVVYPTNTAHPNGVVYPNQGVVCNTQMYTPMYSTPALPYPQSTSTPNSCTSSVSNTAYCGQLPDMNAQNASPLPNYAHIVQNMNQMGLNTSTPLQSYNQGSKVLVQNIGFDGRSQKPLPPKGNKFNNPRSFIINSSQSSTGTSSPATTVVASYCSNQPQNVYRTPPPPETPTIQHCYGANFTQPFMYRQNSNIQSSPPNTTRNSRSPTPGSDVLQIGDIKPRFPITNVPHVYTGMPYVLQTDTRIVPGRGQPSAYRQQFKPQNFQNTDKMHKNRKSRGNKMTNIQQHPNTKL